MKTAILTLTESRNYKIDFFDNAILFDVHVWKCRTKVRDILKASGVKLQKGSRIRWWPLEVGEQKRFIVDDPSNWFWSAQ